MTNPTNSIDDAGVASPADEEMLDILRRVQSGELSVEQAEQMLGPASGAYEQIQPARAVPDSQDFSAPLGKTANGKLVFERGIAGLTLQGEALPGQLFKANFERHVPVVRVNGGTVTIRYRAFGFGFLNWLRYGLNSPHSNVTLNIEIPWQIDMRGGMAHSRLDLHSVKLRGFTLHSGGSDIELTLGEPNGVVKIDCHGGVNNLSILRPAAVAVRLTIHGGAANLALDNQRFAAVGGMTSLETPDAQKVAFYYVVTVHGGANNLRVGAL
jgi:hypothetical protein